MRTSEAVTGASGIPVGYATLALVYAGSRGRGRVDAAPPRARAHGLPEPPLEPEGEHERWLRFPSS